MSVTAIIPTTCESSRGPSLRRAILSVVDQIPENGLILIVANGDRIDESVVRMAEGFPRTRVERLEEASVAKAQQLGRHLVTTEFFCFLDDDDEYLPGAFSMRLDELRADPSVDVVVTNGFERIDNDATDQSGASRTCAGGPASRIAARKLARVLRRFFSYAIRDARLLRRPYLFFRVDPSRLQACIETGYTVHRYSDVSHTFEPQFGLQVTGLSPGAAAGIGQIADWIYHPTCGER